MFQQQWFSKNSSLYLFVFVFVYLLKLNWLAQVAGEDINFDTFCTGAARRRGFRLESTFPAVVCQLGAKGIPRPNSLPPE